jgi:hypothetical protein
MLMGVTTGSIVKDLAPQQHIVVNNRLLFVGHHNQCWADSSPPALLLQKLVLFIKRFETL